MKEQLAAMEEQLVAINALLDRILAKREAAVAAPYPPLSPLPSPPSSPFSWSVPINPIPFPTQFPTIRSIPLADPPKTIISSVLQPYDPPTKIPNPIPLTSIFPPPTVSHSNGFSSPLLSKPLCLPNPSPNAPSLSSTTAVPTAAISNPMLTPTPVTIHRFPPALAVPDLPDPPPSLLRMEKVFDGRQAQGGGRSILFHVNALLLKACSEAPSVSLVVMIHEQAIKSGCSSLISVQNFLAYMYVSCGDIGLGKLAFNGIVECYDASVNMILGGPLKCGCLDDALQLFDEMSERDVITWSVIINRLVQDSRFKERLKHFQMMLEEETAMSYHSEKLLGEEVLIQSSLALPKAKPEGLRKAHVRDGVAVVQSLVWLDHQMKEICGTSCYFLEPKKTGESNTLGLIKLIEVNVSDKLESLRAMQEHFKGLSFPTISSVGPNAVAICYFPKAKTCRELDYESICLFDSGAQYEVWKDRPPTQYFHVVLNLLEIAGQTISDKLMKVREKLTHEKVCGIIITTLDEVVWLYNIRGNDVNCNPVVHAFAIVTTESAVFYFDMWKVSSKVYNHMVQNGIEIKEYNLVESTVSLLGSGQLSYSGRLVIKGLGNDALRLCSQIEMEGVSPNNVTFVGVLNACSDSGATNPQPILEDKDILKGKAMLQAKASFTVKQIN